jgi:hypothetical protein
MTNEQKTRTLAMRRAGASFSEIAVKLGVSVSAVKAFCWRNEANLDAPDAAASAQPNTHCQQCGESLEYAPKQKLRRFCCSQCRDRYWRAHRDEHRTTALHRRTCAYCGQLFTYYGGDPRKYCCHPCYIAARFHRETARR